MRTNAPADLAPAQPGSGPELAPSSAPLSAGTTNAEPIRAVEDPGFGALAHSAITTNTAAGLPSAPENRGPLVLEQDLPTAIEFLARMANMNIQFDPSLVFTNAAPSADGKSAGAPIVKLNWENVTAEDALQEVLDNYSLMLVVNPKSGVGRVTRRPTQAPLASALVQLNYASPTNIIEVLKSTFVDPRSKVTADLRTSQLVIVTTEREMYAVTNLITQLDTPTARC